jgi:hypothetical protein
MDYTDADLIGEMHYPQIGALIGDGYDLREDCAMWNVEPLGEEVSAPVVSDIPTLILSGEFDPNTPPGGGSLVAETLSRSYVFTFPGVGHNVVGNSLCAQSMVLDFLAEPTEEPDAGCLSDMGRRFVVPADEVELAPFTDQAVGLRGVLPTTWARAGAGLFAGLDSGGNLAFLLVVRLPDMPRDQYLTHRLERLGVDALPPRTDYYETPALSWELYSFEGNVPALGGQIMVDYAIADSGSTEYLVGLHVVPDEYEDLHESIFISMLDALTPLGGYD